ncbi:glycosyltransferase [Aneurinibacillus aneurinilyticus]|uniref:glycosyltransferase n=1 Tax=Aneurinibacillus aneurinilyticus TaxID=1391 RepID=UPI0023F05B5E|nr:glycosyltransferase [Aneurinibacillus aneurinilyticus]
MRKPPCLTLCMLVRDDESWIVRCFNSVKDIVDEIIIVDIGSSDRTIEICQSFEAQVFRFPWNGNFSDACNLGLEHATGDWILWLHADEELDENDRNKLRTHLDKKEYNAFSLPLFTYYGKVPVTENVIHTSHIRLFRNRMGYHFTHPIYEKLNIQGVENDQRIHSLDVKIHQYRYLNDVMKKRKQEDTGIERTFHPLVQSFITKRNYIMSLDLLEKLEPIGLSNDWLNSMKGLSFIGIGLSSKAQVLLSNVSGSSLYYLPSLEALCILAWVEGKFDEADMYVKQIETITDHDERASAFRLLHQLFTKNHVDDTKKMDTEVVYDVFGKLLELRGKKQLEQLSVFVHGTGNAALERKMIELAGEFGYAPMNIVSSENLQESTLSYVEHALSQQNISKARNLYKQILYYSPFQDDIRGKLTAALFLELSQLLSTQVTLHPNLTNLSQAVTRLQSAFEIPFHPS